VCQLLGEAVVIRFLRTIAGLFPHWRSHFRREARARILRNLRTRTNSATRGVFAEGHPISSMGCSPDELLDYLESKFYGKMSWTSYGEEWSIDHIMPLKNFDLGDKDQFLAAIHYTNLQPLSNDDHRKKTSEGIRERAKEQ